MPDSLPSSDAELQVILRGIADGVTAQDPRGNIVYANDAAARTMGFESVGELLSTPVHEVMQRFEVLTEDGSPLPLEELPGRLALRGIEPPDMVIRFRIRATGEERWSHVRARPVFSGNGEVELAVNIFRDITERRRAEEELRARAAQQAAVVELGQAALEGREVAWLLEEACRVVAKTLDVEYAKVLELLPGDAELLVRAGIGFNEGHVGVTRVPVTSDTQAGYTLASAAPVRTQDIRADPRFTGHEILHRHGVVSGLTVAIRLSNRPFGVMGAHTRRRRVFTDDDVNFLQGIANVLGAAIEREQLYRAERAARADAESAQWGLAVLAVASNALASSLDYEQTLSNVARLLVPGFADWCSIDLARQDGALENVALAHVDADKVDMAHSLRDRYPPDPDAPQGAPEVIRTGNSQLIPEVSDEMLIAAARDEEHLELIRGLGIRSVMIVPLEARGRRFGAITFVSAESARVYGSAELALAEELGRRAGVAIENALLYEERSRIARVLQQTLLPPALPEIPGVEVAARYRPAGEGTEVGGDFYDVFETREGQWALVMGDVCGKGTDAAALTGLARHTLRAAAMREPRPSRVLDLLNAALLQQLTEQRFCTVCYGSLEHADGTARMTLSFGGHPPALVLRSDGKFGSVGKPGTILGVFPDPELFDVVVELRPGDAVVFYTDGLIEEHVGGREVGEEALADVVRSSAGLDAAGIVERIERAILEAQPGPPRDDMAVLVLRLSPGPTTGRAPRTD